MKGKSDAWIVDPSTAHNFMVFQQNWVLSFLVTLIDIEKQGLKKLKMILGK